MNLDDFKNNLLKFGFILDDAWSSWNQFWYAYKNSENRAIAIKYNNNNNKYEFFIWSEPKFTSESKLFFAGEPIKAKNIDNAYSIINDLMIEIKNIIKKNRFDKINEL